MLVNRIWEASDSTRTYLEWIFNRYGSRRECYALTFDEVAAVTARANENYRAWTNGDRPDDYREHHHLGLDSHGRD